MPGVFLTITETDMIMRMFTGYLRMNEIDCNTDFL